MPVWSPGFYRVEDYAAKVQSLTVRGRGGAELAVTRPQPNRWRVATGGAAEVTVAYTLLCTSRSVTTDWVGEDMGVFNGSATYITLAARNIQQFVRADSALWGALPFPR